MNEVKARGFTLIELLVVLAIIATLLSLVAPRYHASVDRAKEAALRANLRHVWAAIDQFAGDTGRFPASLDELVERRYLRELPMDPMTERRDTWVLLAGAPAPAIAAGEPPAPGVSDVRSGAPGVSRDGSRYAAW